MAEEIKTIKKVLSPDGEFQFTPDENTLNEIANVSIIASEAKEKANNAYDVANAANTTANDNKDRLDTIEEDLEDLSLDDIKDVPNFVKVAGLKYDEIYTDENGDEYEGVIGLENIMYTGSDGDNNNESSGSSIDLGDYATKDDVKEYVSSEIDKLSETVSEKVIENLSTENGIMTTETFEKTKEVEIYSNINASKSQAVSESKTYTDEKLSEFASSSEVSGMKSDIDILKSDISAIENELDTVAHESEVNSAKTEAIESANETTTNKLLNYYTKIETDNRISDAQATIVSDVNSHIQTLDSAIDQIKNSDIPNTMNESKAYTDEKLSDYYTKSETYSKTEIDNQNASNESVILEYIKKYVSDQDEVYLKLAKDYADSKIVASPVDIGAGAELASGTLYLVYEE